MKTIAIVFRRQESLHLQPVGLHCWKRDSGYVEAQGGRHHIVAYSGGHVRYPLHNALSAGRPLSFK